jgi:hypothetical protein
VGSQHRRSGRIAYERGNFNEVRGSGHGQDSHADTMAARGGGKGICSASAELSANDRSLACCDDRWIKKCNPRLWKVATMNKVPIRVEPLSTYAERRGVPASVVTRHGERCIDLDWMTLAFSIARRFTIRPNML